MASTYLQRTFSTPTSRKIFTVSLWFKRASLGSTQNLFGSGTGTNTDGFGLIDFLSDDRFRVTETPDYATSSYDVYTSRKFRDTSAWYHVVVAMDTTQATASNRIKIYTNGQLETSLDTASYPSLNLDTKITLNNSHIIGRRVNSATDYFNGNMAHFHFIDGTAYDASAFGETDATTGIWKPKTAPSVTYGTNGFFLKFENSGSMGTDSSGNANNFTVNGTMTQTIDTPSNVFTTGNTLNVPTSNLPTFSDGNNTVAIASASRVGLISTLGITQGKWYAEFKLTATSSENASIGITGEPSELCIDNNFGGQSASNGVSYTAGGTLYDDGVTTSSWGDSFAVNDIIGVAVDLDNNYIYFSKNGVFQNSGIPTSGASGTGGVSLTSVASVVEGAYFFNTGCLSVTNTNTISANFGNGYFGTTPVASAQNPDDGIGIFEYTVPTGYKALCTKSINAQEYS